MSDDNIIDLKPGKDGVYSEEGKHRPMPVPVKGKKKTQKPNTDNMNQFFTGMDLGLDFVEGMQKRINRIMKLKK